MRDGISEIVSIIIAVMVLILVPTGLKIMETHIRLESTAEKEIFNTISYVNKEGCLIRAEADYIYSIASFQKHPQHLYMYTMEAVNNGDFGEYLYRIDEGQLMELFEKQESIILPEGGVIGAHR